MVKDKRCKNKSTKCPRDRYNSFLTTLSDFFSTKVQTYWLNDCFEVKKSSSFFKKVLLPAKYSAGQVKCSFVNPIEFIAKPSKEFSTKVPKREKLKTKCSKKHFRQDVVMDTQSAILRNFSEVFRQKFEQFSIKSHKKRTRLIFPKKNPQYVSLDMKCNFDNDVGIVPTKNKSVSLKVGKRWKLIQILY